MPEITTTKFICDRCGKETPSRYGNMPVLDKESRSPRELILSVDYLYPRYAVLCNGCCDSFSKWWEEDI